jgi:peptidyl-prolyl cis-trans isomerase B (cyclophilin B)
LTISATRRIGGALSSPAVRRPPTVAAVGLWLALLAGCGGSASTAKKAPTRASGPLPAGCRSVKAPAPKGPQHLPRPHGRLDPSKTWTLTLQTNCGQIAIRLAVRRAPRTAASVASLARAGFYDGLTFHRIAHDPSGGPFVIQGGDPDGTGQGGPGYTVVEAPPASTRYLRGTVAMAKTATDPAGASGSQFFVVTAPDAQLPPDYALLGTVTGDAAAVRRIAAVKAGPPPDERPLAPVVIERATVSSG